MPFCRECGKVVQDDWNSCPFCKEDIQVTNIQDSVVMGDITHVVNKPEDIAAAITDKICVFCETSGIITFFPCANSKCDEKYCEHCPGSEPNINCPNCKLLLGKIAKKEFEIKENNQANSTVEEAERALVQWEDDLAMNKRYLRETDAQLEAALVPVMISLVVGIIILNVTDIDFDFSDGTWGAIGGPGSLFCLLWLIGTMGIGWLSAVLQGQEGMTQPSHWQTDFGRDPAYPGFKKESINKYIEDRETVSKFNKQKYLERNEDLNKELAALNRELY